MGESAGVLVTIILILLILLELYYLRVIGSGTGNFSSIIIPKCSGPGGSLGYDGSKWSCKCDPGWTGAECSTYNGTGSTSLNINIPRCYAPGGALSYDGKNWTCSCIAGWSGVGCGDFDHANAYVVPSVPICTAPGGTLGFDGVKWNCLCNLGFFGTSCDMSTTGTGGPNCHHGLGVYNSVAGDWSCTCNQGWTGCDCSLAIEPPPSNDSIILSCF